MLTKSTLAAGEDYATASDLLGTEDLHEETLRIWGKPFRVRGLTFWEREQVRATAWRDDGQRDFPALVKGYLQYGITAPHMNDAQLDSFMRKHAGSVEAIYMYIDRLTELDYDVIVAQALYLAGLAGGAKSPDAGGDEGADNRPVDRPARKARGRASAGAPAAD
jgi:hypothetical protein